jgi:arylsulfatase A-like enzyme
MTAMPFCVGLKAALVAAALCSLGAAPPRPNVVLIVADDLGRGDLGCYGATKIATPNIDRLAREGVRFTDAHSTCAVCQPSRYAILGGTYFFRAQRKPNQLYFHEGQPTLPGVLQAAGYRTAGFGKWHLGFGRTSVVDFNAELKPGPLEIGFDHYFGTPLTHNEPPFVFFENHHVVGLDPADPIEIVAAKDTQEGWGHGISIGGKKAHELRPVETIDLILAEKAADWIAKQPRSVPFFTYIPFLAPHVPIAPAKEWQGKSQAGSYGDYVQQLDACVGRVLDALEAQKLKDTTLVIFTSDNGGLHHGEAIAAGHRTNGDLLGQKTDAWEGGHRIPLIARLPGRIPAGDTCDRLFGLVDLMATITGLCDVSLPTGAGPDSIDQHTLWERPAAAAIRDELVLHGTGGFGLRRGHSVFLPRQGSMGMTVPLEHGQPHKKPFGQPWKNLGLVTEDVSAEGVIDREAPAEQLYDLAVDPTQKNNIVLDRPDVAQSMRERLESLGPKQPKLPPVVAAVGRAFLEQHCHACHDPATQEAGLDLETLSRDLTAPETLARWVLIHDRIAKGEMPPPDEERPPEGDRQAVLAALDDWLTTADKATRKNDGRAVYRRLTGAEYETALRDLLAIPHLEVRSMLPADSTRRGFEKVGDGLDLSHVQIQQYLAAADRALDLAIATRPTPPPVLKKRFDVATMLKFRQNLDAGAAVLFDGFKPDAGWYGDGLKKKGEPPAQLPPGFLEGKAVGFFGTNIAGQEKLISFVPIHPGVYRMRMSLWSFFWNDGKVEPSPRTEVAMLQTQNRVFGYYDAPSLAPEVHEITAWLSDQQAPMFDVASMTWRTGERHNTSGTGLSNHRPGIAIDWFEVEGPLNDTWPPESHRMVFANLPIKAFDAAVDGRPPGRPTIHDAKWAWPSVRDQPKEEWEPILASVSSSDPAGDSRRLLATFLPRAFRRAVTDDEVARYAKIATDRIAMGDCFEDAMRQTYKAVLTSPHFLFRRETPGPLDDTAVATRLAFWLWNGPPDAALLDVAHAGKLRDLAILRGQVERLLDDPRSDRFVVDFLDQWLSLSKIDDTDPDQKLYPEFQFFYLKESMLAESRAFFRELIKDDLPITSLVVTDFAMLNERLVQHYRIPGLEPAEVIGSRIRRVTLPPGSQRGGFLTQGAVLKVTANGSVTSPVLRGVFVAERFLGDPVPPPPPNVPAIEPDTRGATTMRELLVRHRADPACAGCHRKMDPPGFALERFDPIGGWRDRYRSEGKGDPATELLFDDRLPRFKLGQPIDASGDMPDGAVFADFDEFRQILVADRGQLARAFVAQLVMYATGAEPSFADRREIERIVASTAAGGHGIRSLIHALAESRLFLDK